MGPQCGRPTQFGRGVTRRSKGSRVTVAGDEAVEGACQDALEARRHWRAGWMEPKPLMRRGTVLKRPEAPHGANAALWLLGDVSSNPAELCRAVAEANNRTQRSRGAELKARTIAGRQLRSAFPLESHGAATYQRPPTEAFLEG